MLVNWKFHIAVAGSKYIGMKDNVLSTTQCDCSFYACSFIHKLLKSIATEKRYLNCFKDKIYEINKAIKTLSLEQFNFS